MEVVGKSLLVWRVPILSDQEESATPVRLSHQRYLAWTALQRLDLLDTNILVDNPSLSQAGEEVHHEWLFLPIMPPSTRGRGVADTVLHGGAARLEANMVPIADLLSHGLVDHHHPHLITVPVLDVVGVCPRVPLVIVKVDPVVDNSIGAAARHSRR